MQEKILNHLIEKYSPVGIIEHGSRAGGYATPHSDWDFFILVERDLPGRRAKDSEKFEDQFLDITIKQFPIIDQELGYFARYMSTAKLVYSDSTHVDEMFKQMQEKYTEGIHFTIDEILSHRKELREEIERLQDWISDESGVFFMRIAGLYQEFYDLWWNIKKQQYSISPRHGVVIIQQEDPEFYDNLLVLAGKSANGEKYAALSKLENILFS